jgi:hypothetical protein
MANDLMGSMLLGSFTAAMKLTGGLIKGAAGLGNALVSSHRNRRMVKQVEQANQMNRGVTEYLPSPLENLYDSGKPIVNMVISGGNAGLRAKGLMLQALCAAIQDLPVIVLHESNTLLEETACSLLGNSGRLTLINPAQPAYEPFLGLRDQEIGKLVYQSIPASYGIKPIARDYIEAMAAYLRVKVGEPYLAMFLKCPHRDLFAIVNKAEQTGKLSAAEGNKIRSLLASGQSERAGIETWFDALQAEINPILARSAKIPERVSPVTAVLQQRVLLLDIVSQSNENLLHLIVQQVQRIMAAGGAMMLAIDGISLRQHDALRHLVLRKADKCKTLVSNEDVYAALGGEDKEFATLLGNSDKTLLFRQSSALTCARWSEAFGQYEKQEVSTSHGKSSTQTGLFTLFPQQGANESVNVAPKRDFIIRPEEIQRMQPKEVYFTEAADGSLSHMFLE